MKKPLNLSDKTIVKIKSQLHNNVQLKVKSYLPKQIKHDYKMSLAFSRAHCNFWNAFQESELKAYLYAIVEIKDFKYNFSVEADLKSNYDVMPSSIKVSDAQISKKLNSK